MTMIYQHDAYGYYLGEFSDYGGPVPSNAVTIAPEVVEGYFPQWVDGEWVQVENHKGEEGFLNGEPYTIKKYGPYPDGWTKERQYTEEEQYNNERSVVEQKYTAPWNGTSGGILTMLQMSIVTANVVGVDSSALAEQYKAELVNMAAEFDVIDSKYGVE